MTGSALPSSSDLEKSKNRAALVSLLAALALTALKLAVGLATNSLAVMSEALHSGLDLVAAGLTWYAIRLSSRPADRRHPYGHGKAENLSALAETLLLLGVCAYVGWECAHRLLGQVSPVMPSPWAVGVMLVSMAVDINRVRVLRRVAKRSRSQALEADAMHFSTDILSSAVVFVGVLAVWLADFLALPEPVARVLRQADTVAALVVALVILRVSLGMARRCLDLLMDASAQDVSGDIESLVSRVPGVMAVSRLRTRSSGSSTFVDLCVGVDPRLRVSEGHRVASAVEEAVRGFVPDADVTVHVDPVTAPAGEDTAAAVRSSALALGLDVHGVQLVETAPGAARVEVTLAFDGAMPYAQAHARADSLVAALRRRRPGLEVVTHLAPESVARPSTDYSPEDSPMAAAAYAQVERVLAGHGVTAAPHAFRFSLRQGLGPCLSFHCALPGQSTVAFVHEATVRMERELREALPALGRVVIHVDPAEAAD